MTERMPKVIRRLPALMATVVGVFVAAGGLLLWAVELQVTVRAEGILIPKTYVQVRAEREGIIHTILVKENQAVTQGELLATLYDEEDRDQMARAEAALNVARAKVKQAEVERELTTLLGEASLLAAQADLQAAEADWHNVEAGANPEAVRVAEEAVTEARIKLAEAQRKLALNQELYREQLIPPEHLHQAEYLYQLAQSDYQRNLKSLDFVKNRYTGLQKEVFLAKVEGKKADTAKANAYPLTVRAKESQELTAKEEMRQVEINLQVWRRRVEKARIYAPVEGRVLSPDLESLVGKKVEPGEVLMVVGDCRTMRVRAVIPENHLPQIRQGLAALVYVNAYPYTEYQVFEGRLVEIAPSLYSLEKSADGGKPPPFLESVLTRQQQETGDTPPQRFYTIATVELSQSFIEREGQLKELEPGLSASVEIIVRQTAALQLVWEKLKRSRQFIANLHVRL